MEDTTKKYSNHLVFKKIYSLLIYLFRSLMLYFLLFYFLNSSGNFTIFSMDLFSATKIVAALDVLRALFYALLFPALFLMFVPLGFLRSLSWRWRSFFLLAAAGFCGGLPFYILSDYRPGFGLLTPVIALVILCGINACAIIILSNKKTFNYSITGRILVRLPILADSLLPMAVWMEYGKKLPWTFRLLRIVPVLYLLFPIALITMNSLPPRNVFPKIEKDISQIHTFPLDSFHTKPGPDEKELWISKLQSLTKVDILNEKSEITVDIPTYPVEGRGANVFAFDDKKETILAAGHVNDDVRLIKIEADSLKILWDLSFKIPGGHKMHRSITMWDEEKHIALAAYDSGFIENEGGGLLRFSEDLRTATHFISCGNLYDAVEDFNNSRVFALFIRPGLIVSFDIDSLNMRKAAMIPQMGEKLLYDPKGKRLFVAFPMEGLIRIYNTDSLELEETVSAVIGVKSMFLLEDENRFIASGYSPYVEVFAADKMRLIHRFKAPAWQRSIDLSPTRKRLYFSTFVGVWWISIQQVLMDKGNERLGQYDPFFFLLRFSTPIIQNLFGLQPVKGKRADVDSCRSATKFEVPILGEKLND